MMHEETGIGVAPAGAQSRVAPAGAQGIVAPAGAQSRVAPEGARDKVAPEGAQGEITTREDARGAASPGDAAGGGAADPRRARLRIALAAREEEIGARRARREALLARLRAGLGKRRGRASEAENEVAADALEAFLARLDPVAETGEKPPQPARLASPVLPLARRAAGTPPAETAAGAAGLARLPGAGPGLVATLIRAGIPDLATLAALGPEGLAERLGPLARLIDLGAWLDFARAETAGRPDLPAAG